MEVRVEPRSDTSDEIRRHLASYRRDAEALDRRREELLAACPNEWVSISDDRLFHAKELDALLAALRLDAIDPARVPLEYLSPDAPALLL